MVGQADADDPLLADPGVAVPLPSDPVARVVARHLVACPADPRTLAEWAAQLGCSVSSLRRAFRSGTSMTFTAWRTQVRLRAALLLLAQDIPVASVAGRVGYSSLTGFVDAFRRHFGQTPAAHFRDIADESVSHLMAATQRPA